jgi:hypothetical protein
VLGGKVCAGVDPTHVLLETADGHELLPTAGRLADGWSVFCRPPENAIVICVDEKSSIQALERAQGYLKLPIGRALSSKSRVYQKRLKDRFAHQCARRLLCGGVKLACRQGVNFGRRLTDGTNVARARDHPTTER